MFKILGMTKEEILNLGPDKLQDRILTSDEIVYIAKTLDSYWQYDYEAAKRGKVGKHALLKSERHSDGFFVSKILLQYQNIRTIMALQLVQRFYLETELSDPKWVAGIPDGATQLGEEVAIIMEAKNAKMEKVDGKIKIISEIAPNESLLLIEDFCTRGTGFKEAVLDIKSKQPNVYILPLELVIINRGGLKRIIVEDAGIFEIVAAAEYQVNDWEPAECPLCKMGSIPIKPKATDENWHLITTSQK